MESVHKAVQHNLINPIFIGNENEIKKYAEKLKWNISKYKIINEKMKIILLQLLLNWRVKEKSKL